MSSEDSGYLALRWNNHEHVFSSLINSLRIQEKYCDVSLSCGGRFFSAHKFVLEACSSYFSTLFQTTPCKHPVIFMRDVTVDQLEAILDFMYKGVIHVEQEQLPGILRTAEALKIKGLAVPDSKNEEQADFSDVLQTPVTKKRKIADDAPKHPQSVATTPIHPLHNSQTSDFNLSPPSLKRYKVTQPSLSNDTNPLLALLDTVLATGKDTADTRDINEVDQDDFTAKSDGSVELVKNTVNTQLENWNGEAEETNAEVLQVDLSADSSQFIIGPAADNIKEENEESGSTSRCSPDGDAPPKLSSKDSKAATAGALAPKKPFECPLCGHTFTRRDNLANHLKTHTGDRPFMCQFCHKCFSRKDYLKQHERIHTGEKPYQCTQCDRSFTRKEGMTDHMRCHFESKEFTCDVCNKSFKQKCGLRFHKRNYQH